MTFALGSIVATPNALEHLEKAGNTPAEYLSRHARGDWGEELCAEDRRTNDAALKNGSRLLSAYKLKTGEKVWIITEADRSATTVLMPEDY